MRYLRSLSGPLRRISIVLVFGAALLACAVLALWLQGQGNDVLIWIFALLFLVGGLLYYLHELHGLFRLLVLVGRWIKDQWEL